MEEEKIRELKARAWKAIDRRAEELERFVRDVGKHAEVGFFETRTSARLEEFLKGLRLPVQSGFALTGVEALFDAGKPGPKVAVLGELDSVVCFDAPDADPVTGAAHQCGHHVQLGVLLATAVGLVESGQELAGKVVFMGVPAEEYIQIERRLKLKEEGKIHFIGGKAELIRLGRFDDVDMTMMIHAASNRPEASVDRSQTSNGFVGLTVRYIGRQAHAAASPDQGVNALNAAVLGISAVNALRETFRDEDHVRVHFIITKGGDLVNCVPDDVRLEAYVRASSVPVIEETLARVVRAFKAGGDAIGAKTECRVLPGMFPLSGCPELYELFYKNSEPLVPKENFFNGGHMSGSTDMGDVSQIMPAMQPSTGGMDGALHAAEARVTDYNAAVIVPGKAMVAALIDLLSDDAARARHIVSSFKPNLTRDEYLKKLNSYFEYAHKLEA
ncbi:MAG: amidohydrolase [Synergistaceae bacterium]|jgi:amidohydrolase|nr:amidohydrolase [Synergistaceae bacterium]